MSTNLHPDFIRFSEVVVKAIATAWDDKLVDFQSDGRPKLWPPNFTSCRTDFDRVTVLLNLPEVRCFSLEPASVSDACHSNLKTDSRSTELRELGNQAWRANNVATALILYTKAIFYASTSEVKALAFANRSCVLARLGAHSAVLEDIDRAIQYHYPSGQLCRLLVRRAQALLNLNNVDEAYVAFLKAKELLTNALENSIGLTKLIETGMKQCGVISAQSDVGDFSFVSRIPPLYVCHPDPPVPSNSTETKKTAGESLSNLSGAISSQSDMFKVSYLDETVEWQVVANKLIKPGELILIDTPYARRIHDDQVFDYCYRCFRRSINLFPCRGCSEVGFCSVACEEASWAPLWFEDGTDKEGLELFIGQSRHPSHRFECGQVHRLCLRDYAGWKHMRSQPPPVIASEFLKSYHAQLRECSVDSCVGGPMVAWLSFAVVARTNPVNLRDLAQNITDSTSTVMKEPSPFPLLAFSGARHRPACGLQADDYSTVGWLTSNSNKRTPHDLWQRTVAAVFLTHCLSAGGYPLDWDPDRCLQDPTSLSFWPPDTRLPASWAAACILHQVQAIASNAHSFSTEYYCCCTEIVDDSKWVTKPVSRQPSILKRDCSPGVELSNLNTCEVGSALYPVLSLINHSCNPNVAHVYLANGDCGLYALRVIRAGEALYGNYGYHYATHPLAERRRLLLDQYCFECQCEACLENWSNLNLDLKLRCRQCCGLIDLSKNATSVSCPNTISANIQSECRCSKSVQRTSIKLYNKLYKSFQELCTQIPMDFMDKQFHRLSGKFLDKQIAKVSHMLDLGAFEGVLVRPAMPFDYLQELLKVLLNLRYGCVFMLSDLLKPIN
ncbi:SET and MYND domain-containing protein 4 [Paragonimus heterotremus]|uniref:Protein-lysine N-methyltransferase SMYD4 n=1 Tax=Paragonimus heterotremus TaxID=100268 RepID=A0A8J4SMS8_9TREM|nr:SET and MYND domain-containing protein 4 [Paragonimus heterotremus]